MHTSLSPSDLNSDCTSGSDDTCDLVYSPRTAPECARFLLTGCKPTLLTTRVFGGDESQPLGTQWSLVVPSTFLEEEIRVMFPLPESLALDDDPSGWYSSLVRVVLTIRMLVGASRRTDLEIEMRRNALRSFASRRLVGELDKLRSAVSAVSTAFCSPECHDLLRAWFDRPYISMLSWHDVPHCNLSSAVEIRRVLNHCAEYCCCYTGRFSLLMHGDGGSEDARDTRVVEWNIPRACEFRQAIAARSVAK